jgi:hypothetical protein
MLKKAILSAGLIAAAGMLAGAGGRVAAQVVTATWSSVASSVGGNAINASAAFNIDPSKGTLTITLLNQTVVSSPGDLLREVDFSLSPTATINSISDASPVGYLLDVSGGTVNSSTLDINSALPRNGNAQKGWAIGSGNTGTPTADYALSTPSGDDLVMGPPSGTPLSQLPPYYALNETISGATGIGNGGHSYVLDGVATFTLNVSGLTDSTNVSDISLGFGTAAGEGFVTPSDVTPPPVPAGIPATLPLVGGGLLGLGALAMRRRRTL